ncbi:trehalose-phosphatase [Pseudolysinimonas sp.]|uniref:trehalose-phosphatase n=1 Tax=Pseudolysinimonas sp. TaxID=2680009 RepID=UPI003F7E30DA
MDEPLDPGLVDALRAFAGPGRVLVALDFDGTLAPIADHPGGARTLPAAHDAIERLLAAPETEVAYVSGRSLASLVDAARPPAGSLLVGSHGIEVRLDDGAEPLALHDDERARVRELHDLLEQVATRHEGVWVEDKPAGSALHTRQADDDVAETAEREALAETEARLPGLTSRGGKRILEFSVRDATKGDGLDLLRAHVGADRVLYAGDDLTDEDAFAVLRDGDVGIRSGPGETRAAFRVAGPEEMAAALALLADARA